MLARIFGTADPWSLVPIRVALGVIFIAHGADKLFVSGLPGFARMVGTLGFHPAMAWAVMVSLVEFLGGLAILAGFMTRWAALLIAIEMTIIMLRLKLSRGLTAAGGFEFELLIWAACLTLFLTGAKTPSVDQALPGELRRAA